MKCVRLSQILGAVTCVLFAATAFAQTQPTYMLVSSGLVRVNGVTVPRSTVVFPGDIIETTKGAAAKISAPGTSMLVSENSSVSVDGNSKLVVTSGSAGANYTSGVTVLASGLATLNPTVTPALTDNPPTFNQLSATPITALCKDSRHCPCRTSNNCPPAQ